MVVAGCAMPRNRVPGQTDLEVDEVVFRGATLASGPLAAKLGLRAPGLTWAGQPWNPYRAAEDKKRIRAYWQTYGFFDVVVGGPDVERSEAEKQVKVIWTVEEGHRYHIGRIEVAGAPEGHQPALRALIPFETGDVIDMEAYRLARVKLSEHLRRHGYAHAETWSRTFVDRRANAVHWYYFVDAGPPTRVGEVVVEGARKIPPEVVLERMGLTRGEPFDLEDRDKAELDLLDTGAFSLVRIETTAHNEFLIGKLPPDTGGLLPPERVDPEGKLVPRPLSPDIDLQVTLREGPSVQGRWGVGGSIDPQRVDASTSLGVTFPNLLGPMHHLTLDGRFAYGLLWRGSSDEPLGFYGNARVRLNRPGGLWRLLDWRITAELEEHLFTGFHVRELWGGVGFRSTLERGLYLDLDVRFRWQTPIGFGEIDADLARREAIGAGEMLGGELSAALVWDERNDRVEPTSGWLLAARARFAPGQPLGTHRYLRLGAEARGFIPLGFDLSVALRAGYGVILFPDQNGVPLGVRLYGGGAYGHRGFGYRGMGSYVDTCQGGSCGSKNAGALTLAEGSVELRWLPYRKQWGLSVFCDLGGATSSINPFERLPSVAVGAGLRLRTWYVPVAIDFAYRVTDEPHFAGVEPFWVFVRVGEAF
jgi:outer membrane translocation and assembly module TamA